MLIKNKILHITTLLKSYFLPTFCLASFVIAIFFYITGINIIFWEQVIALYICSILGAITLFLYTEKRININIFVKQICLYLFVDGLCILTFLQINQSAKHHLIAYLPLIFLFTLITGSYFLFKNLNVLSINIPKVPSFVKSNLIINIVLILIIAAGFLLRLYELGRLNVLVDEQFAFYAAKNLLINGTPTVHYTTADFFGDIYYSRTIPLTYLVAFSFYIFGISEFSLRLPSIIISTATIYYLYLLGKELTGNKWVGILSAGFFAFSSWAIFYGRYARHYVFDGFLAIALIYHLLKGWTSRDSSIHKIYFTFFLISIPWIELNLLIILLPIFIFLIFEKGVKNIITTKSNWIILITFVISLTQYFIFTGAHTYHNIYQAPSEDRYAICVNTTCKFFVFAEGIYNGLFKNIHFNNYFFTLLYSYSPYLLILASLGLILFFTKIKLNKIIATLPILLIFMSFYNPWSSGSSIIYRSWEPRDVSFLIPLFFLYTTIAIYLLWMNNKKTIAITASIVTILTGVSTIPYTLKYGIDIKDTPYQIMESERFYTNTKAPALYVLNNFKATDKLIFDPMEYLYKVYLDIEPNWRIGWPEPKDYKSLDQYNLLMEQYHFIPDDIAILDEKIKKVVSINERVWLIDSSYNNINLKSRVRKGNIRKFLDTEAQKCLVYSEAYTRVFLFNNSCWNTSSDKINNASTQITN